MEQNEKNRMAVYIALGLVFGCGAGALIGIAADNLSFGIAFGAGLGLVMAAVMNGVKNKR